MSLSKVFHQKAAFRHSKTRRVCWPQDKVYEWCIEPEHQLCHDRMNCSKYEQEHGSEFFIRHWKLVIGVFVVLITNSSAILTSENLRRLQPPLLALVLSDYAQDPRYSRRFFELACGRTIHRGCVCSLLRISLKRQQVEHQSSLALLKRIQAEIRQEILVMLKRLGPSNQAANNRPTGGAGDAGIGT